MKDYTPNERIVDRVCELWVRMLRSPKYDNGDHSPAGFMATAMASMLPVSGNDALERFRAELKSRLMVPFTHPPYREGAEPYTEWVTSLNTDYHPDRVLSDAAGAAGLGTQFPWKTNMSFYGPAVSVSAGYAAPTVYHYPTTSGRWLLTSLSGKEADVTALVAFAEAGHKAEFFSIESARELAAA